MIKNDEKAQNAKWSAREKPRAMFSEQVKPLERRDLLARAAFKNV